MPQFIKTIIGVTTSGLLFIHSAEGHAQPGFIDAHIHFNWDQRELINAEQIVTKLKRSNVEAAVVSGTPSSLALALKEAGGDMIIPFFSPYTHEMGKYDWHIDPRIVALAEEGLRTQRYLGIGEVHFMTGFRPKTSNTIFQKLLKLAETYAVPVLIHIDSGNEKAFLDVCLPNKNISFLFAHAGGNLRPSHIRPIVEQCQNVVVELSARDPWRYGGITDDDFQLLPEWRALILDYPDRFVIGTDPVWRVTRTQSWDQPDDGWDHFEKLVAFHQRWISNLPAAVQNKLRRDNAKRVFSIK